MHVVLDDQDFRGLRHKRVLLPSEPGVERAIETQDMDSRFAQKARQRAFDRLFHDQTDVCLRHIARLRDTVDLEKGRLGRSEEHTSELQSLMRISYAVLCLKKNT